MEETFQQLRGEGEHRRVLIVQAFTKVPALHVLAPTQQEPPFAIVQGVVLLLFVALASSQYAGSGPLRRWRKPEPPESLGA